MIRFTMVTTGRPRTKTKNCRGCGAFFKPKKITQIFCNQKCKRKYYNTKHKSKKLIISISPKRYCQECGAPIYDYARKYCNKCKSSAYKKVRQKLQKEKGCYYRRFFLRRMPFDYEQLRNMSFDAFQVLNKLSKKVDLSSVKMRRKNIEEILDNVEDIYEQEKRGY